MTVHRLSGNDAEKPPDIKCTCFFQITLKKEGIIIQFYAMKKCGYNINDNTFKQKKNCLKPKTVLKNRSGKHLQN